jgi:hypothetical protein
MAASDVLRKSSDSNVNFGSYGTVSDLSAGDLIMDFTNDDLGLDDRDGFPNPAIHSVNVQTEQINRVAHSPIC